MTFNILLLIILVTVAVSYSAFNNRSIIDRLIYIPYIVKNEQKYEGILGHTLIHADWMHLAFNMVSLYFLGDLFLRALIIKYGVYVGQVHFLSLYILGALFATLIPYVRNQDNPAYRSLGASGAVSAVIFAAILWYPGMNLRLFFIPIDIPAYVFGPLYLVYEWYADRKGNTGIAHDAHIGGAVFGILYVLIINIDKGKEFIQYFIG